MKELEFNLDENPFMDFLSSRYAMSARVNVEKLWKWCKSNDKSFFIMSMGCLMNATNSVPQLKRRILNLVLYPASQLVDLAVMPVAVVSIMQMHPLRTSCPASLRTVTNDSLILAVRQIQSAVAVAVAAEDKNRLFKSTFNKVLFCFMEGNYDIGKTPNRILAV